MYVRSLWHDRDACRQNFEKDHRTTVPCKWVARSKPAQSRVEIITLYLRTEEDMRVIVASEDSAHYIRFKFTMVVQTSQKTVALSKLSLSGYQGSGAESRLRGIEERTKIARSANALAHLLIMMALMHT